MGHIVVIGSLNIDLVTLADQLPQKGETVKGKSFNLLPGGKGLNQAINIWQFTDQVTMIGCMGDDVFGHHLKSHYKKLGFFLEHVEQVPHMPTGVAQITLHKDDNRIIIIPGANDEVTPKMIDQKLEEVLKADLVVLQHEIPEDTVTYIINVCYENQVPVLLNPAPARKVSLDLIEKVTYLTPNEHEFDLLFNGQTVEQILKRYPNKLIVTCGEAGIRYHDGHHEHHIKANRVEVVDTTGAGDAFNGAFAFYISRHYTIAEALELSNQYASESVTWFGAQPPSGNRKVSP